MQFSIKIFLLLGLTLVLGTSCVSKKKFRASQTNLQNQLEAANKDLGKCGVRLNDLMAKLSACETEKSDSRAETASIRREIRLREEQIQDLRAQLADCKSTRDQQVSQTEDLVKMSQSATDNIRETLSQLERKDKYIHLLQAAKTRADSINLALAVNLKGVLKDGLDDKDVEVKVDKTVVFINLSDKMLYQSGSANITSKANEVLGKIAKIVESRPDLEVMVEGYTDNLPIKNACIEDNWDLSVKRATSVVRALQNGFKIDPNRLIAAGRGQWNTLASNDTEAGRSTNRRTRIIILPKIDQFYDLLNPANVPKQ